MRIVRDFLKRILYILPRPVRTTVVRIRELWWRLVMVRWERQTYPHLPAQVRREKRIQNILVYHISGLTHAGTEKNLQLIANILADTYRVYFMYGDKVVTPGRSATLDPRIIQIPFSYSESQVGVPHRITGMRPHLKEVLAEHDIDLIITASPGYAHYPWNVVSNTPIILSNIFGAPALQKNIVATIFMSQTVREHAEAWTGPRTTHHTKYLPIGKLPPTNTVDLGRALRERLNIAEADFIFGRIGRDDDGIFDPIGIRAWQQIADQHPNAHYLIMSPPPVLVKIVTSEQIPRVHFLPPSGKEEDVWAFHGAIDCFAHFRYDGETSGVAIAESLTAGNPVISHRSRIWNAHLEYLTEDCARIAETDDFAAYASFMREYIMLHKEEKKSWEARRAAARYTGEKHFSPQKYARDFLSIVSNLQGS